MQKECGKEKFEGKFAPFGNKQFQPRDSGAQRDHYNHFIALIVHQITETSITSAVEDGNNKLSFKKINFKNRNYLQGIKLEIKK